VIFVLVQLPTVKYSVTNFSSQAMVSDLPVLGPADSGPLKRTPSLEMGTTDRIYTAYAEESS